MISYFVFVYLTLHSMIIGRRRWHPTPVLLPGKSHGWRSLVGCSAWGRKESDTTEQLHFHFSLSCIGEGNGNPLQCSCLENPRDGGAWWAAVYGSHRVGHDWSDLAAAMSVIDVDSIPWDWYRGDMTDAAVGGMGLSNGAWIHSLGYSWKPRGDFTFLR